MKRRICLMLAGMVIGGTAQAADVSQDAIDACIDGLRATGGAAAQGGTVLGTEFSEANSLVMLQDGSGAVWRCIVSNDGRDPYLTAVDAAGTGEGAASGEPSTTTERVRFEAGATGVEIIGVLTPGSSTRYVLNARNGQNLYVRVAHRSGPRLDFQVFNPDGSFLLDMIPTDREYRGELWQSGDHVIEVINRGGKTVEYNVIFGID